MESDSRSMVWWCIDCEEEWDDNDKHNSHEWAAWGGTSEVNNIYVYDKERHKWELVFM